MRGKKEYIKPEITMIINEDLCNAEDCHWVSGWRNDEGEINKDNDKSYDHPYWGGGWGSNNAKTSPIWDELL